MNKQTYWLADSAGTKLAVEGAQVRDYLAARGWTETSEATGDEFIWVRHPDIAGASRIPVASLEGWQAKGWEMGAAGVPVFEDEPEPPAPTETKPDSKPKPAAGGNPKEN